MFGGVSMKKNVKRWTGIILSAAILITAMIIPPLGGLSTESVRALGILVVTMIFLVTEPVPVGITAPLLIVLLSLMNVVTLQAALSNSMTTLFLFLMACYGISSVLLKSSLPYRLAYYLLKKARGKSIWIIGAFMLCTAVISSLVSNVPCALIITGICTSVLAAMGEKPGESRLGRALLLAVPFGAVFGGMMTPAGSSLNILSMQLVEQATGIDILFIEWMMVGIPLALVMIAISIPILKLLFKPEDISPEKMEMALAEVQHDKKLTRYDIKAIVILSATFILWILTSWIPWINVTVVSVFALVTFFLPGLDMLSWKEYSRECGWDTILICSAILSVGAALVSTGLTDWVVSQVSSVFVGTGIFIFIVLIAAIVNWTHLLIPTASAIVVLYAVAFAGLAVSLGIDPRIVTFSVAAMSSCVLLIPFDPVVIVAYTTRYFKIKDLFTAGVIVSTIWTLLLGLWLPIVFSIL